MSHGAMRARFGLLALLAGFLPFPTTGAVPARPSSQRADDKAATSRSIPVRVIALGDCKAPAFLHPSAVKQAKQIEFCIIDTEYKRGRERWFEYSTPPRLLVPEKSIMLQSGADVGTNSEWKVTARLLDPENNRLYFEWMRGPDLWRETKRWVLLLTYQLVSSPPAPDVSGDDVVEILEYRIVEWKAGSPAVDELHRVHIVKRRDRKSE